MKKIKTSFALLSSRDGLNISNFVNNFLFIHLTWLFLLLLGSYIIIDHLLMLLLLLIDNLLIIFEFSAGYTRGIVQCLNILRLLSVGLRNELDLLMRITKSIIIIPSCLAS